MGQADDAADRASEDRIGRLADLTGLARGYRDVFGDWREPGPAALREILAALGYTDTGPGVEAAIAELEAREHGLAPPIVVGWIEADASNAPARIAVPLAPQAGPVSWSLVDEAGADMLSGHGSGTVDLALAPGIYRLAIAAADARRQDSIVIAAPATCHIPDVFADGGRVWGISVQLYSLRSSRNWGIGDFSDLARLATKAGRAGAALIGVNPLHARSMAAPEEASPYAPVSRLALDTLAIDVEAVPELALADGLRQRLATPEFAATLDRLRQAAMVDYTGVAAIKMAALRELHRAFRSAASPTRRARYAKFVAGAGPGLISYAQFEAVRLLGAGAAEAGSGKALSQPVGTPAAWWDWPASLRRRDAAALADPAIQAETEFQLYLQFLADEQLARVGSAARSAGMTIGLYRDLAVAAARDGAEAWADPSLISELAVGAAPDAFSETGQNWGLPALNPLVLERAAFRPLQALLAANMAGSGALRLDHAMALQRLFVIPPGADGRSGTFLGFPLEAMTAVVTLESRRCAALMIAEALGSVPEGFEPALERHALLAYKIVTFEWDHGELRSPRRYPHLSCAMFSTHDMPTVAGYWLGRDLDLRAAVGQLTAAAAAAGREARAKERHSLCRLFEAEGIEAPSPDQTMPADVTAFIDAVHRLLAQSNAAIALAQLDDVLGERDAVNLPGTSTEHPNWRRKLGLAIDTPEFDLAFERAARIFRESRGRSAPRSHVSEPPADPDPAS